MSRFCSMCGSEADLPGKRVCSMCLSVPGPKYEEEMARIEAYYAAKQKAEEDWRKYCEEQEQP